MVKGISHIAFNVADMERSIDFYCNVLGLDKIFEIMIPENIAEIFPGNPITALAGKPGIVCLQVAPGEFIELFYPMPDTDLHSGGPNYTRIGYVHLSLVVYDIHDTSEVMRKHGVTIDTEISKGPDNTFQFWIKDPDGNRIEFMQYTDQSYQVVYDKASLP
ncbi:MAG TPA: VOC family protein [Clostridiales bacterium]|nr:VOC family protein [Clostridiales bacterium]